MFLKSGNRGRRSFSLIVATMALVFFGASVAGAAPDESIQLVDADGGWDTSIVLDSSGFPVVSYFNPTTLVLTLTHCNDINCAGGDESIEVVDSAVLSGTDTSLVLDASGFPVISYSDLFGTVIKIAHCNDVNCAGADESISVIGSNANHTSLRLDASGNPVVAYHGLLAADGELRLVHCNDPNCVGSDESNVVVDNGSTNMGEFPSLQLDSSGNPVIAYSDQTNGELEFVHCNDANCVGGDEAMTTLEGPSLGGSVTSMKLDSAGNPVIAYARTTTTNQEIRLLHCNDAICAGADESIETLDSTSGLVSSLSLQLDSTGNPVLAYGEPSGGNLKLAHCNDVNCTGGDESLELVDASANVGTHASLQIDSIGLPVISYYNTTNTDLMVAHCNDVNCAEDVTGPVATVNLGSAQAALADSGPVTFTVTFDETVTGFDPSDIVISGSAGATAGTIAGSGQTYTVTISSIPTSGTITLAVAGGAVSDSVGNPSTTTVVEDTVTVDGEAPVITVPSDITVPVSPGESDAPVTFVVTATDGGAPIAVTCTPASGSSFPIGTTTVECSAIDPAGNTTTETFDITVSDDEPPLIVSPGDQTISAPSPTGGVANYSPATATDNSGTVTVVCDPAVGSTFSIGATTVTCTATDAAGNATQVSFVVTMTAPATNTTSTTAVTPTTAARPSSLAVTGRNFNLWYGVSMIAGGAGLVGVTRRRRSMG